MNQALADVGRGFAQPVHGAQQVFRALLDAMSRPGRVLTLDSTTVGTLDCTGLAPATTAVLLTVLDAETSLWLHPARQSPAAQAYLKFHTGVQLVEAAPRAAFAAMQAADASAALWADLARGSDAVPQDGATLIVEVPSLQAGPDLSLRGPGIETVQTLCVGGLDAGFWQARASLEAAFPLGIELILTCGHQLAALPRSTRVSLEG